MWRCLWWSSSRGGTCLGGSTASHPHPEVITKRDELEEENDKNGPNTCMLARQCYEWKMQEHLTPTSSTSSSLLEAMEGSMRDSGSNSLGSEWIIALLRRFLHAAVMAAFVT